MLSVAEGFEEVIISVDDFVKLNSLMAFDTGFDSANPNAISTEVRTYFCFGYMILWFSGSYLGGLPRDGIVADYQAEQLYSSDHLAPGRCKQIESVTRDLSDGPRYLRSLP